MTEKIFHSSVICKYCLQPAPHAPIKRLQAMNIYIYFCSLCQAEYVYHNDYTVWSESIYVTVGSKMFRWTQSATGAGQIWYIGTPGIPGIIENKNLVIIKQFIDDIPVITPSNIHKKLHTWLTFL